MNSRITVAFDLDDTFLSSREAMTQIMAEETGVYLTPEHWTSYDLAKVWTESGRLNGRVVTNIEVMEWFVKHNLFSRCTLAPGSMEVYEFCQRRNIPIEFITARGFDPDARNRTTKMLLESGVTNFTLSIVDHLGPKFEHMVDPNPTLFVDDNFVQYRHMLSRSRSFLMAQPHNAAERSKQPELVVYSMWDVLDILAATNGTAL